MLNIDQISIFLSVFVFFTGKTKNADTASGRICNPHHFCQKTQVVCFCFPNPRPFFQNGLSFPDWFLVPHSAIPHHTALSHGLEEQQNRILLVHTARPAAKNPFTIDTIEHPEMLHFPEKIFEICIYAQFCNHQIVKDAQILFSGRDLQKKIPFCIDLCYNKKKHRKNRRHDRQLCETCA